MVGESESECGVLPVVRRREPLLQQLSQAPARPCELASELELSRTTIDRGLSELHDASLVERTLDRGAYRYQLTVAGDLALSEFARLSNRLEQATRSSNLLATLPAETRLSWEFLDGAIPVTQESDATRLAASLPIDRDPSRASDRDECAITERTLEALLETGTHHRVVVPGPTRCVARAYCAVVDSDVTVEVIAPDAAVQALLGDFQEGTANALSAGQLALREATRTPPYGLIAVARERPDAVDRSPEESDDETAAPIALAIVVICDDEGDGDLRGLLVNDSPAACEWARETVETLSETAQPLSLSGR